MPASNTVNDMNNDGNDDDKREESESSSIEVVDVPSSPSSAGDDDVRESVYFDTQQEDGDTGQETTKKPNNTNTSGDETKENASKERPSRRTYREDITNPRPTRKRQFPAMRRLSRQLSVQLQRRSSSIIEALPETPAGWTVLVSFLLSSALGHELRLQKSLIKPPDTFCQTAPGTALSSIYQRLTAGDDSILSRSIQPSLFVGTRGLLSSTAAYLLGGPSRSESHLRFRDIITSTIDNARFAVDWEVPWKTDDPRTTRLTADERREEILNGPIQEPVVIILHGINNDASFGYIKALARSFANRGWNAAAMNFRGTGGVPMNTPRGYNAAYTGDLRCLVWVISSRLAEGVPVFLVGNSLGANVMTKYLGEEGLAGTLPRCVSGAAALGNPLSIYSEVIRFPFNVALALGVKETMLHNFSTFMKMNDPFSKKIFWNAMKSGTVASLDRAAAPLQVRSGAFYPFAFRIGYKSGEAYWTDSSSFRVVKFISIPYLSLMASDDFMVAHAHRNKIGFLLSNPNVMVTETQCGGHLGWHESPPDSKSSFGAKSWADAVVADFFQAVMASNKERHGTRVSEHTGSGGRSTLGDEIPSDETFAARDTLKEEARRFTGRMKSKL